MIHKTQDKNKRQGIPKGEINNRQYRETGNIGYTRHRTKINVREYRRGQSIIDNLEKLTIQDTQDTGQK